MLQEAGERPGMQGLLQCTAEIKKAEQTKGTNLRHLGHLDHLRPGAFRPPLARSLALSGLSYFN
jgi:hypothetical protein